VTPVLFPLSAVPEKYRLIFFINPMTPIVEMYKWGLLGIGQFPGAELALSIAVMLAILSTGVVYFNRSEAASVDRL